LKTGLFLNRSTTGEFNGAAKAGTCPSQSKDAPPPSWIATARRRFSFKTKNPAHISVSRGMKICRLAALIPGAGRQLRSSRQLEEMAHGQLQASGFICHGGNGIAIGKGFATGRANNGALQVGQHISGGYNRVGPLFQLGGPLLDGAVDLAQIIDANVLSRRGTGINHIRDSDGRQESNDSNHNHNLDQSETGVTGQSNFHIFLTFTSARFH